MQQSEISLKASGTQQNCSRYPAATVRSKVTLIAVRAVLDNAWRMTRPKLSIRPARKSDLAALIDLYRDDHLGVTREATEIDEAYQSAFDAIEADPNHMLVVGERHGKIVATLLLSFLPGLSRHGAWRAQIESMRVSGASRGQGIGQELLDWSIEKARQHGCSLVQLTSDRRRASAQRFYERAGFEPTHYGYKMSLEA